LAAFKIEVADGAVKKIFEDRFYVTPLSPPVQKGSLFSTWPTEEETETSRQYLVQPPIRRQYGNTNLAAWARAAAIDKSRKSSYTPPPSTPTLDFDSPSTLTSNGTLALPYGMDNSEADSSDIATMSPDSVCSKRLTKGRKFFL